LSSEGEVVDLRGRGIGSEDCREPTL